MRTFSLALSSLLLLLAAAGCPGCPAPAEGEGEGEPRDGGVEGEGEGEGEEGEGEGEGGEGEGEGERVDAGPEPEEDVAGLDARPANPTCVVPDRPVDNADVVLTRVFPNLDLESPLFLTEAPGDLTNFYVIERAGRVVRFDRNDNTVTTPAVFCDIRGRVETSDSGNDERGLLGIAFHPDFAANREVYLSYTAINDNAICSFDDPSDCVFESRVSRFLLDDDGTCDEDSEVILLDIDDFAGNHNGGHMLFGPDGTLMLGMGDGGAANDPLRTGQDLGTLLGKMIRIDVDRAENGKNYAIPADNPFRNVAGALPEIYASGMRNPWRFSFDRGSGDLWVADVGQNILEEVNVVQAGGNYGWSVFEATDCFRSQAECDLGGFLPPIVEYAHQNGRFSTTGGYVYRGTAIPDLVGTYVWADFVSKEIFKLTFNDLGVAGFVPMTTMQGQGVASFAEDRAGELYVVDLGGRLFRVDAAGPPAADTFPRLLSQTGCVDPVDHEQFASGVIPYQLNAPFYSDGAAKSRGVAMPDGAQATITADGDVEFPVGTVTMKSFRVAGELVETRLLVRHDDGEWAGYTYEWDGDDANLVESGGKAKTVGNGQLWTYPSRAGCMVCHTAAGGRTLGPEVGQLNGGLVYPQTGRLANQLFTWSEIGLFTNPPADLTGLPAYAPVDLATAPLNDRLDSYLHVNCSFCHRPGGGGQSPMDLRLTTAPASRNVCGATPSQGNGGVDGAQLIFPGDPARSMVSLRMKRQGAGRMPPIGSNVIDSAGVDVIDRAITELAACPE